MRKVLKVFKWILNIVIVLAIFIGVINLLPTAPRGYKPKNNFRKTGDYPLNIPHGGAKLEAPENTIYAYEKLDESDYAIPILEIDLTLTKNGEFLITHHNLDLGFGANELIKDLTYQEIKQLYEDDNYSLARTFFDTQGLTAPAEEEFKKMIPADLDLDIFEKFKEEEYLYILEIKDVPLANKDDPKYQESLEWSRKASDKLIELVKKHDLGSKVVLSSFSDVVISYFHEKYPEGITNFGEEETTNFAIFTAFFIDFFWNTKSQVLIIPNVKSYSTPLSQGTTDLLNKIPKFISKTMAIQDVEGKYWPNLANKRIIDAAHRKNIAVYFWTINDPEEMEMLIDLGVDGIITDYPTILNDIIETRKNKD